MKAVLIFEITVLKTMIYMKEMYTRTLKMLQFVPETCASVVNINEI
jgi:hypothetical protein